MTRLLTPKITTMTELREPHKVFERAGGKPVGREELLTVAGEVRERLARVIAAIPA